MVDMVPWHYFHLGSVRVLLCNEALGTSSSLAVEGEAMQIGFSRYPPVVSTEFAVFLLFTKCFSTLAIYRGKAYSIRDK